MANKDNQTNHSLTMRITYTAMLTAVYFLLSALFKIPVAGHITVDLGYIALMVGAVCFGPVPAMLIGALGALLESMTMAQRGISIGWIVMNAIVGYLCGLVFSKLSNINSKHFIIIAVLVVFGSVFLGVAAKTLIDCAIYKLPLIAKIPTGIVACVLDSSVMLIFGLPLSLELKKRI